MEINPCPFCGSKKQKVDSKCGKFYYKGNVKVQRHSISVRCKSCFARGPVLGVELPYSEPLSVKLYFDKAINMWNERK